MAVITQGLDYVLLLIFLKVEIGREDLGSQKPRLLPLALSVLEPVQGQ